MNPVDRAAGQALASYAVCMEVLEHVDDPSTLLRNATSMLLPGAKVIVTVPGGPRSAFDKHIGHRTHFTAQSPNDVLAAAGLGVDRVLRAGFPGFNLYKMAVVMRGKKLIGAAESRQHGASASKVEALANRVFSGVFRLNRDDARFGWQMAAVAHVPAVEVQSC